MFTDVVIIVIMLLAWAANIAATGRLFKASGRAASTGYLIGLFFSWPLGVVIGLIMLAKGPPKPKPYNDGGVVPPDGVWRDAPPGFRGPSYPDTWRSFHGGDGG
jgi:hypothetical protein